MEDSLLLPSQLERGVAAVGDAHRLRRKLRTGAPLTFVALGASNVLRGGCHGWQQSKCASSQYSGASGGGDGRGWLLRAFDALNATWPHRGHRLINRAHMATGPQLYQQCTNLYVPHTADAVLLGFADICGKSHDAALFGGPFDRLADSPFLQSLESIVRSLLARPDPPAVVLYNSFTFRVHRDKRYFEASFSEQCDGALHELAAYYHLGAVSVRDALFHHARRWRRDGVATVPSPLSYKGWSPDYGLHFDLRNGSRIAAELLMAWLRRAVERDAPRAAPVGAEPLTRGARATSAAACFTFDDTFDGTLRQPRVVKSEPPGKWRFARFAPGDANGTRRLKPGYVSSARGATLTVDTLHVAAVAAPSVAGRVHVGFLQTYASRALAVLRCVRPTCSCDELRMSAHTDALASTTVLEPRGGHPFFSTPQSPARGSCLIELELLSGSKEGAFKFVALQVTASPDEAASKTVGPRELAPP